MQSSIKETEDKLTALINIENKTIEIVEQDVNVNLSIHSLVVKTLPEKTGNRFSIDIDLSEEAIEVLIGYLYVVKATMKQNFLNKMAETLKPIAGEPPAKSDEIQREVE